MIGVLLQKAHADDLGDFHNQLLIIGKNIRSDELDYFHKGAFFTQNSQYFAAVFHKERINVGIVPVGKIPVVFRIAFHPVDGRIVSCIGKAFVQRPKAAGEAFGVLGNRLGKIRALG